jgi:hypothetical protein
MSGISPVSATGCYSEAHNNVIDEFEKSCSFVSKLTIKDNGDDADGLITRVFKIFSLIVLFIPFGIFHGAYSLYSKVTECCGKTTIKLHPDPKTKPKEKTEPTEPIAETPTTKKTVEVVEEILPAPKNPVIQPTLKPPAPQTGPVAAKPPAEEQPAVELTPIVEEPTTPLEGPVNAKLPEEEQSLAESTPSVDEPATPPEGPVAVTEPIPIAPPLEPEVEEEVEIAELDADPVSTQIQAEPEKETVAAAEERRKGKLRIEDLVDGNVHHIRYTAQTEPAPSSPSSGTRPPEFHDEYALD